MTFVFMAVGGFLLGGALSLQRQGRRGGAVVLLAATGMIAFGLGVVMAL